MLNTKRSMRKIDVVVIALGSPILIGLYEAGTLIESLESESKSSDYLPEVFETLLKEYEINHIVYANGPGSFMAIKMSYLFFKTLEITQGIKLLSAWGFDFNGQTPIKAMGKLYFHYQDGEIEVKPLNNDSLQSMQLPAKFDATEYSNDTAPNYIVPAVS